MGCLRGPDITHFPLYEEKLSRKLISEGRSQSAASREGNALSSTRRANQIYTMYWGHYALDLLNIAQIGWIKFFKKRKVQHLDTTDRVASSLLPTSVRANVTAFVATNKSTEQNQTLCSVTQSLLYICCVMFISVLSDVCIC